MAIRRSIYKLFRIKNLIIITLLIIFIYVLRILNSATLDLIGDDALVREIQKEAEAEAQQPSFDFTSRNTKKIDWHDYKYIKYDLERTGIGEQGLPAQLNDTDKELEKELYSVNGFNGAISDKIALNRSLPDIRHPKCRHKTYLSYLPTVSVVIPFHNEHWSTLLRTVYSVINRSPPTLLKEIFLVDDASTKEFLGAKLERYLKEHFQKVRILRLTKRSGLITARLTGARRATADVLVFLDSHTEANVNWLPPLLEPIAQDYRTAVCPFIDVVAYDTLKYQAQDEGARGAFDWEFFYKRLPVLPADQDNMPEPFKNPVMAGGLFAISSKFFWELGGYDEGLDIWGGEQYELSFKIWQCGGRMFDAPCSRVGHIYRKFAPFPNPGHGDFVGKNYRRVAEVWMDEYAQYLYQRRPQYLKIDPGDLTQQRAIRTQLKCKSFRWFMTQVAFDLPAKYPPVEPKHFGEGKIRSVTEPHMCIDAKYGKQMDRLYLTACDASGELEFQLTWHKDIRSKERSMCWDVPQSKARSPIVLYSCHLGGGNQLWKYREDTKQLQHGGNDNCLDYDPAKRDVFINHCSGRDTQQWSIDKLDYETLAQWQGMGERITGPVEIVNE